MFPTPRTDLVHRVEDYFRDVDRFETAAILAHLTDDCVLEIVNHDSIHRGIEAIRASYDRRAKAVKRSWHGDFLHSVDELGHLVDVLLRQEHGRVCEEIALDINELIRQGCVFKMCSQLCTQRLPVYRNAVTIFVQSF